MIGGYLYPHMLDRDLSRLGYKPDCQFGWSSEYLKNQCMHARVSLLPKRAGDTAKSGELSWVEFNPISLREMIRSASITWYTAWSMEYRVTLLRPWSFQNCWKWHVCPLISSWARSWPLSTRKPDCWPPALVVIWVHKRIDAFMPQWVCCVQSRPDAPMTWWNRVNSPDRIRPMGVREINYTRHFYSVLNAPKSLTHSAGLPQTPLA